MPDINPDQNQAPQTQNSEPQAKKSNLLAIFLAFVIVILIAIFLFNGNKNNQLQRKPVDSQTQNQETAENQNASVPTPTDTQSAVEGTSTTSSIDGTSSPAQTQTVLTGNIYKNAALGFELILPDDLKGKPSGTSTVNFLNIKTGKLAGTIEVLTSTSTKSLGDLTVSLENNPDITKISYTTLDSQPSLLFTAMTPLKSGIATLYNNYIYYLRGDLAKPEIAAAFRFD